MQKYTAHNIFKKYILFNHEWILLIFKTNYRHIFAVTYLTYKSN